MAFSLKLSAALAKMLWKVKIRDKERVEDPHITIIHKTESWRVCLRDGSFMDGGSWKDMPDGLQEIIEANLVRLCAESLSGKGGWIRESAAPSKDERHAYGHFPARPCLALRTRGCCFLLYRTDSEWDEMYPHNPMHGNDGDDDGDKAK